MEAGMNDIQITLVGNMVTDPVSRTVGNDVTVTTFRIASTPRHFDRSAGEWRDGETTFLPVTCWRRLAQHTAASLHKGDGVIVQGRLYSRSYDDKDQQRRTSYEVEAVAVGPDLNRGTAQLVRATRSVAAAPDAWNQSLGAEASTPTADSEDPFTSELAGVASVSAA
jgi:single-strand DNA-binding protein